MTVFSKHLWVRVALVFSLFFIVLLAARSEASTQFWKLDDIYVDYKHFKDGSRDPLFFNSHMKEELDLNLDTTVASVGYFDSMVHSMTDQWQFHVVGLNMHAGLRLTPWLDVGLEHYSQHLLDTKYPYGPFPVYDALEVKFYFYKRLPEGALLP